jgi:glyoxalase superfamily protein
MDLVQTRIVTDDVERLAAFYARLVRVSVVLNDYYVEMPTAAASVGFSRRRFTEYREDQAARPCSSRHQAEIMLDFRAGDVDAEYERISRLGVSWVMPHSRIRPPASTSGRPPAHPTTGQPGPAARVPVADTA